MSTDVTRTASSFDPNDEQLVRYLGLDPNRPADRAAVKVAQHYGLDPLLKHVIVIPKGGVYLTRDGLLHIAHRSGQLNGIVVEEDPHIVDGEWIARVSVYRHDMTHPFTYPGRYPVDGGNRTYAPEMALKAAEAHALRRAFDVNGLPVHDEFRPDAPHVRTPPQARRTVDVDDVTQALAAPRRTDDDDPPAGTPEPTPTPTDDGPGYPPPADVDPRVPAITGAQLARLMAGFAKLNIDRDQRLDILSNITGRVIGSASELTKTEASVVLAELANRTGDES